MKNPKSLLLFSFLIFSEIMNGQKVQHVHIDSIECNDPFDIQLKLSDRKVLKALKEAENYIRRIAGDNILQHIWLNYCESRESGFPLYSKDFKQPKRLGDDTCYELSYFVIDKIDTIGYFMLLVDKYGKPMKYEDDAGLFNHAELIRGFKKHFDKQFKFSYSQAVALGRKKGYAIKPVLQCELDNHFTADNDNQVFVKVKYYWSFDQRWTGGEAYLNVNAENGLIEKEMYIPPMVK